MNERVLGTVSRATDGLMNAVYRVTWREAGGSIGVRIVTSDRRRFDKECALLLCLHGGLPVQELLEVRAEDKGPPCQVYRWIDGITLNACRRDHTPDALASLAAPLGGLLATVAAYSLDDLHPTAATLLQRDALLIDRTLRTAAGQLHSGRARARLGARLADALAEWYEQDALQLRTLDEDLALVHGDLGGRNVIVVPNADGSWRPAGLIDWENAAIGAPLWDIGSLFRYAHRYDEEFRDYFARGYLSAGGGLPNDWWVTARLLDATRVVNILDSDADLPDVYAECQLLMQSLMRDLAA